MTICALTMVAPYYDCNEEWDIVIFDKTHDHIPFTENALGRAIYYRVGENDRIELVYDYKDRTGKHDYMMKGGGVLWHEILHQFCKCNWHEYADKKDDIKRSTKSNSFGMRIPIEIRSYLTDGWWQR